MMEAPPAPWTPTDRPMNRSERRLLCLLATLGTPVVPQVQIGPYVVDFLFPDLRIVVESDSLLYHLASEHARRDRLRDQDLQEAGFLVIHVWSDNLYRKGGFAKILRHIRLRALRGRGVRLGPRRSGGGSRSSPRGPDDPLPVEAASSVAEA